MTDQEIIEAVPADEGNELLVASEINLNGSLDTIVKTVSKEGFYTTFDTTSMEGKRKLFKATNAAMLLRDYMETPIDLAHVAFSPSEVITEDGEIKTVMAGYLIDSEGNVYMSSSQGVIKSLVRLLDQFGDPEDWDGDVTVVCRETNTARGRRYKFLDVE